MNSNEMRELDNKGARIGIFVIAYDAESRIRDTLERIPETVWRAIEVLYIVDDCSRDETVAKALSFDRWKEKTVVLRNRTTQQYGGNQKIGYQYALDRGLDLVVLLHADGQFAPESLPEMLEPLLADRADVVIGSRLLRGREAVAEGMPAIRYWGNRMLTAAQNKLSGLALSEFHSGYRAYRTAFLKHVPFWEDTDGWPFDTQILLQARRQGARIAEVPVPVYAGTDIRHVHGVLYALNCLLITLAFFLHEKRVLYSRSFDLSIQGRRYFEKFGDPASSHTLIWNWLGRQDLQGKAVLELGVGDASLTRKLHEAGAIVDGIEIDKAAAELARPYCRNLSVSDLDDTEALGFGPSYDLVIAADVLEHLRHPELVLSKLKRCVRKGGLLVVSLPNVANVYVRLNILLGRFPYHSKGILDRTHLHFYTIRTAVRLVERAGWVVDARDVTSIPLAIVFPFLLQKPMNLLLHLLRALTRIWKGLLAYQVVLFCRNPNESDLL